MKLKSRLSAMGLSLLAFSGASQAVSLGGAAYTQNFDSLGASGTTLPTDWTVWSITTGANSHTQWTTAINPADVGGGSAQSIVSALLDTAITTSTKNAGAFNLAHAATPTDRSLSTSPTGNDGTALQLSLTNNTGSALGAIGIGYDIVKFSDGTLQSSQSTATPAYEELPGYELFYSVNGGTSWTNVAVLNPVAVSDGVHPLITPGAPSPSGTAPALDYAVTSINGAVINFGTPVAAGQTLLLRWVDDNAVNVSPDQNIGLDNVSIQAVPEPQTLALWLAGLGAVGLRIQARRRRD